MTEHTLNELKKREREIVTELIALNDLIEILTKNNNSMPWYPRKNPISGDQICPVCEGSGKVIDKNSHEERDCVLCLGKGAVEPKGNAKVHPMPQKELNRIMHITKLR